jgi:hypothetical protein
MNRKQNEMGWRNGENKRSGEEEQKTKRKRWKKRTCSAVVEEE